MNAQLEDFGFLSLIGVIIVFLMFTTNCPPILYRRGTGISWNIKWKSLSLLEYSTIKRHRTCHSALRVLFRRHASYLRSASCLWGVGVRFTSCPPGRGSQARRHGSA